MQFNDREKQLQQILKKDKRFLNFLKDKDVNRKKLVDEKGRKMDIKGFVDLKRKYGLSSKDLKVEKSKQTKNSKKQKRKDVPENDNIHAKQTTAEDVNATNATNGEPMATDADDLQAVGTEAKKLGTTREVSETSLKSKDGRVSTGESKQKIKTFENTSSLKAIKRDEQKRQKKVSPVMTMQALEDFKRQMERNLQKENEEEEEDVAEDKIHKEFTFTVTGPDEPVSEQSDDDGGIDGKPKGKKDRSRREEEKKLTEAEKTDILLLTMDATSVKKSTASDDGCTGGGPRGKRKKKMMIREEVEREVNLEDYEEILTGSRFKSLRENSNFSIDEIKANAVKKRLLTKGR